LVAKAWLHADGNYSISWSIDRFADTIRPAVDYLKSLNFLIINTK
jgi:hypothetical protein